MELKGSLKVSLCSRIGNRTELGGVLLGIEAGTFDRDVGQRSEEVASKPETSYWSSSPHRQTARKPLALGNEVPELVDVLPHRI